ncbi:hypothetical protein SPURM210S_05640 [Streptomyces purpurascens]
MGSGREARPSPAAPGCARRPPWPWPSRPWPAPSAAGGVARETADETIEERVERPCGIPCPRPRPSAPGIAPHPQGGRRPDSLGSLTCPSPARTVAPRLTSRIDAVMSFAEIFTVVVRVSSSSWSATAPAAGRSSTQAVCTGAAQVACNSRSPAALLQRVSRPTARAGRAAAPGGPAGLRVPRRVRRPAGRAASRWPSGGRPCFALACVQPQFVGTCVLGGRSEPLRPPCRSPSRIVNVVLDPVVLILLGMPADGAALGRSPPGRQPLGGPPSPAGGGTPEAGRSRQGRVAPALAPPRCRPPSARAARAVLLGAVPGAVDQPGVGVPAEIADSGRLRAPRAPPRRRPADCVGVSVARIGRPTLSAGVAISLTSVVVLPVGLRDGVAPGLRAVAQPQAAAESRVPVSPVPLMFAARHGSGKDVRTIGSPSY